MVRNTPVESLPLDETAECERCFQIFPADEIYEVDNDLSCEACHV